MIQMVIIVEVIYKTFCLDVAQDPMNGVPNETRTHLCRFAGLEAPRMITI